MIHVIYLLLFSLTAAADATGPRILERPSATYVGISTKFQPGENNWVVLPVLWRRFYERQGEIAHVTRPRIGLVSARRGDGTAIYTAAAEVSSTENIPEGMVAITAPAGLYAEFTHHGPLYALPDTVNYIYGDWMVETPYFRERSAYDIEVYQGGDESSPSFELKYYLPLRQPAHM